MTKKILIIGAFDTKGKEYDLVRKLIKAQGCEVLTMNFGVLGGTDLFPVDFENTAVAQAGGGDIFELQKNKGRGTAMKVMGKGVAVLAKKLYDEGIVGGVFGMGGGGGTSVVTKAMRELPIGVPKVMVSTIAATDTTDYVGFKDVTMIPSIVDVAGLNRISEKVFKQAAGAICGMVQMDYDPSLEQKPIITASMFGNTTSCVNRCQNALAEKGYEVLIFHATGIGGRTMEGLVDEGYVHGVLDITTTEWADTVCGGIFSAGENRCEAPGRVGIPHLLVPGCVDMANFGRKNTIPEKYKGRLLYEWNPDNTLMRTNIEENRKIGEILAQKANASKAPVAFLLPLKGVSMLDKEGEKFWWPEADQALFEAIKNSVNPNIEVIEMDCNINDEAFSDKAVEKLLELIG